MRLIVGSLSVIVIPLFILNALGAIVGGLWLFWLGEWRIVLMYFGVTVISGPLLGLSLAPTLCLAIPAGRCLMTGRNAAAATLGALSLLVKAAILSGWLICTLRMGFWLLRGDSLWPVLILGYATAIAPVAWLAQREGSPGNTPPEETVLLLLVTQISPATSAI